MRKCLKHKRPINTTFDSIFDLKHNHFDNISLKRYIMRDYYIEVAYNKSLYLIFMLSKQTQARKR